MRSVRLVLVSCALLLRAACSDVAHLFINLSVLEETEEVYTIFT